jgi:hypothetical protein
MEKEYQVEITFVGTVNYKIMAETDPENVRAWTTAAIHHHSESSKTSKSQGFSADW